jgi:hypothetical protein
MHSFAPIAGETAARFAFLGKAITLNADEEALAEEAMRALEAEDRDDVEIARQRFDCLASFGKTIALFPFIREAQMILGSARTDRQLIESLTGLSPSSNLLHIPARIQAVRSFLVTKFHAFSLLSKLLKCGERGDYRYDENSFTLCARIRRAVMSVLFTIMAEDVYFSCLDEASFPVEMKAILADDLIDLWDTGDELAMVKHFPALEALWTARNESPPSFGTLDGTSEIFRISIDLGDDWHDFLIDRLSDEETKWALDEFLFGLSYEELVSVRERLVRYGVAAVGFDEIRSYLGAKSAYSIEKNPDPRALYDFYIDRKQASLMRKRLGAPGPRKTIEEIYLKHRMHF